MSRALVVLLLPVALLVGAGAHDGESSVGKEHCAAVALCAVTALVAVLPLLARPRDHARRPGGWPVWGRLSSDAQPSVRLTGRSALERLVPMLA
jgi:hypothetical protein